MRPEEPRQDIRVETLPGNLLQGHPEQPVPNHLVQGHLEYRPAQSNAPPTIIFQETAPQSHLNIPPNARSNPANTLQGRPNSRIRLPPNRQIKFFFYHQDFETSGRPEIRD